MKVDFFPKLFPLSKLKSLLKKFENAGTSLFVVTELRKRHLIVAKSVQQCHLVVIKTVVVLDSGGLLIIDMVGSICKCFFRKLYHNLSAKVFLT